MSQDQNKSPQPERIGPEIDPEELDGVEPSDAPADAPAEEPERPDHAEPNERTEGQGQSDQQPPQERPQQRTRTVSTGRTGSYVAPLRSAADADALAQRVKQQALVALQRSEADTIEVTIREAVTVRTERSMDE